MISIYRKFIFAVTFINCSYVCEAQVSGVVLDIETRLPVSSVQIYTNTNKTITTDNAGRYAIFVPFTSVTLSRSGYVKRTLNHDEMKDTVYFLPKSITLNEVVVTAAAPKFGFDLNKVVKQAAAGASSSAHGINFDFFSLFERHKVSSKERERRHKAVANY